MSIALLSLGTLTGSVFLAFWVIDLNTHFLWKSSDLVRIVVGLIGLFSSLLLGGSLWGVGVAWWIGADVRRLAKAGAKGWTGMAFLFAILLEVVNGTQTWIAEVLNLSPHGVFSFSFVIGVFLVVLVTVRGLWARLDQTITSRRVGLICAGTAALGYVLFDWIMQGLGWDLGTHHGVGVSTMVTVMKVNLSGAALFGGAALGWFLGERHVWTSVDV
jgi:hypothetical protein